MVFLRLLVFRRRELDDEGVVGERHGNNLLVVLSRAQNTVEDPFVLFLSSVCLMISDGYPLQLDVGDKYCKFSCSCLTSVLRLISMWRLGAKYSLRALCSPPIEQQATGSVSSRP